MHRSYDLKDKYAVIKQRQKNTFFRRLLIEIIRHFVQLKFELILISRMEGWDEDGMARGRMGIGWNAKQRDGIE